MNKEFVTFTTLAVILIFGWNAFLIHRDTKMFDAYYGETTSLK